MHIGREMHGGRRGQWMHQSANHGSALVALRTLLTFWPWPWPKCQRSPSRISVDHCRSLAGDASPWKRLAPYRRRDGGVLNPRWWSDVCVFVHISWASSSTLDITDKIPRLNTRHICGAHIIVRLLMKMYAITTIEDIFYNFKMYIFSMNTTTCQSYYIIIA